ncbi:MAG TPA: hypothetical protein VIT45_14550 [Allosphingosinicella sp.]
MSGKNQDETPLNEEGGEQGASGSSAGVMGESKGKSGGSAGRGPRDRSGSVRG